jgi:arylsulfatase A-like enzyme
MPLPLFHADELEGQRRFRNIDHQTHEPIPPDEYDARRMVAAYYAQIELLDDQVGRLLDALEASGERENTVVVFTSDHGEMLGDHGLRLKGCRFYDGAVRVPLIISWPGHFVQGVVSEALVELVDVMPTLLEAAGLVVPEHVQGRSLRPILAGDAAPDRHRDFVRCEYHDAIVQPDGSHANMIFDGRYKLVVYHGHGVGELYDQQEDPYEFHNLWDERATEPVRWRLMTQLFDALMLDIDPGQPRVAPY